MNIRIELGRRHRLASWGGGAELAWSTILDVVFADAYHHGLREIRMILPDAGLTSEAETRARLTPEPVRATGHGLAALDGTLVSSGEPRRLYTVTFGSRLRSPVRPGGGENWAVARRLSVYTLRSALWGLIMRAGQITGRPDVVDRAACAMRRTFAVPGRTAGMYHLTVWARC